MAIAYRFPALKQLIRFAPKERRPQHLDRAEALLTEVDSTKRYPFDYLCYRITGYRPDSDTDLVLGGTDVQHDLKLLIDDLSRSVVVPREQFDEPVLTVDALSRKFNVSTRTVSRWRRQGLVARRFLIGGRPKVGFLESSVTRFVQEHHDQVERGSRFRHVSDVEREEIIRRARRMAQVVGQASLAEIARRIARKMERSTETIRMTLKSYDREHPDRAIFAPHPGPLDDEAKA